MSGRGLIRLAALAWALPVLSVPESAAAQANAGGTDEPAAVTDEQVSDVAQALVDRIGELKEAPGGAVTTLQQRRQSDIPDEELMWLAYRFEDALNYGDADALNEQFDFERLGLRTAATFVTDPADQHRFAVGFSQGLAGVNLAQNMVDQIAQLDGYASYLRIRTIDGVRGPLLRYNLGDGGYNWVLLVADTTPAGDVRIVDLYVATNGQFLSTTLGALARLFTDPNDEIVGNVFGLSSVDQDLVDAMRAIGQFQREGDFAAAYRRIQELPEPVRNHRVLVGLAVQLTSVFDSELYLRELDRLASLYGDDPSTSFLLLDHYFETGNFDAAMQSVEALEKTFGEDAAIGLLKTNIAVGSGDTAAAIAFAEHASALEPDSEDGHWALVAAYTRAGRFADTVAVLSTLQQDFGYEFTATDFAGNPTYTEFVRSPEFRAWIAEAVQ